MEEGKPTGITREDVHNLDQVQFEGQQARLFTPPQTRPETWNT
jgi:hypothetical protein